MDEYLNNRAETSVADVLKDAYNKSSGNVKKETVSAGGEKRTYTVQETPPGKKLTWRVSAEEIGQINAGIKEAVDRFYFDEENLRRIRYSAYRFMRHNRCFVSVVSAEDLINQVYVDIRTGLLKLKPYDDAIARCVYTSFRFAVVGGLDEVYIPYRRLGEDV